MYSRKFIRWINKANTRHLVSLAGRPNLPGAQGKGFPLFLNEPTSSFPWKIRAEDHGITEDSSPEKCADAIRSLYTNISKIMVS